MDGKLQQQWRIPAAAGIHEGNLFPDLDSETKETQHTNKKD